MYINTKMHMHINTKMHVQIGHHGCAGPGRHVTALVDAAFRPSAAAAAAQALLAASLADDIRQEPSPDETEL